MNWTIKYICEKEQIAVKKEESLSVDINPRLYACVSFKSDSFTCEGNKVYQINTDVPTEDMRCRLVINWYQDERCIARRYINGVCETCSPQNANHFDVMVLIHTKERFSANFGKFSYKILHDYQPNLVKMAAISLDDISDEESETLDQIKLLEQYISYIDEVGAENPDIILLTEHFHNIGLTLSMEERSIEIDSVIIKKLQEKAAQYNTYIAGSIHRKFDGHYYNTAILIDRNGNIAGMYDKTHLTLTEYEMGITPGTEIPVFDTDFGKVGFLICWDAWFPCLSQILYRKGAKLILNPTLGAGFCQAYADSCETGCYMLVSNGNKDWTRLQNPLGEVVAHTKGNNYFITTVDIDEVFYESALSVGAGGQGRNLYITEARDDLYKEFFETNNLEGIID